MFRQVMIVLLTVMFLGAVAQAGFRIGTRYVDGRPFDPNTDVLDINERLYLSISTDETVWGHMDVYVWALVCDKSLASISGGEAGPDVEWWVEFFGAASKLWSIPEEEDGQWGEIFGLELWPGLYLDNFVYTPLSACDATVRFLRIDDSSGDIQSVPDSIVIHQVPEPATITLFGLSGLLLLRRRQYKSNFKGVQR